MKDKSFTFKLGLFGLGALVILIGSMLIRIPGANTWNNNYVWISLFLIYVAAWLPLLLPIFRSDDKAALFTTGALYWKGLGVYTPVTLALMFAAATKALSHKSLIFGQLVALLILAVTFYVSWSASEHTAAVAEKEARKEAALNEIKNISKSLSLTAGSMSELSDDVKAKISKVANEIRYISPSDNRQARDYEAQIQSLLGELEYALSRYNSNNDKAVLEELDHILMVCAQRKNVY